MRNIRVIKTIAAAFVFGFFFSSCERDIVQNQTPDQKQDKTMEDLLVSSSFNWRLTEVQSLKVNIKSNDGTPLPNVLVEVFDSPKFDMETSQLVPGGEEKVPLFTGQTDADGNIDVKLAVKTSTETLYVCPSYLSLAPQYATDAKSQIYLEIGGVQNHKPAEEIAPKKAGGEYIYLSGYNSNGVPSNLITPRDEFDAAFLASVNASLPERRPVPVYNPDYIAKDTEPNLVLIKDASVWLTFVHEGAGFKNAVGYYTYPKGQEPKSRSEIENYIVTFPNVSLGYDGAGDMIPGDKVQLRYFNEKTGEFQDQFPANTVVAWFLIADGWQRSSRTVDTGKRTVFSTEDFNVERNENKRRHNVLLMDWNRKHLLLGFEDLYRNSGSDEDFNDAVFYTNVEPFDAVDPDNLPDVIDDGDDDDDDDKVFENHVKGTLAYEDLWPAKGDYDFNDLVVDYDFNQVTNVSSEVIRLECEYTVRATGASFHNGFALQLPIAPELVESVEGATLDKGYLSIASNGTEAGQSMAVVPFFEDAYTILPYVGGSFVNTSKDAPYSEPTTHKVVITFKSPVAMTVLGVPPYNSFMIVNHKDEKRFAEVHLPNEKATDLANSALWGQFQDRSDVDAGRTYLSDRNLPWALNIPAQFEYPFEKVEVTKAYLHFAEWAESNGTLFPDWYIEKDSYRNDDLIYSK